MRHTRSLFFVAALCLILPAILPAQEHGPLELTSRLGRKLYAQTEDAGITAARAKLSGRTPAAADYLALSLAQAGRRQYREAVKTDTEGLGKFPDNADLLLERGHRELGLREFVAAQKDLEHAVQVDPARLDSHYHLGLAHYFQGQFAEAALHFGHARDLARTDDSLIDCSNWLYVSFRRAGKQNEAAEVLTRITPAVHNTEPHLAFYLRLLRFYQGKMTEQQILPAKPAAGDTEAELAYNTIRYGVGNWRLYNGDRLGAVPFFESVVAGEAWNSWGFAGAELELAHSRSTLAPKGR
ncbi:MAG TPA: hypothetical protein VGN16_16270 [Acidobacteriaceae bacterium]|jgi:tetratricopeptide (TPR) repeat protein